MLCQNWHRGRTSYLRKSEDAIIPVKLLSAAGVNALRFVSQRAPDLEYNPVSVVFPLWFSLSGFLSLVVNSDLKTLNRKF